MFFYFINRLINVKNFNNYYKIIVLLLAGAFCLSFVFAFSAVTNSPPDYQQGNAVRMMYIHVPAAWFSLLIYSSIAVFSILAFIFRSPFYYLISKAIAVPGLFFTAITLITGAIWGKPIWGAWWVWDARLTSMLILFFLYCGYLLALESFENYQQAEKIAAIIAIVGFINIPFIKFSVEYWNSLHQPASILRSKGIAIDGAMLKPLIFSASSYFSYLLLIIAIRINNLLTSSKIYRIELKNIEKLK